MSAKCKNVFGRLRNFVPLISQKMYFIIVTRLEILSRPKAPKILQKLLSNSEELLSPRPTKLLKDSERFQKNQKESKGFRKIPNDSPES